MWTDFAEQLKQGRKKLDIYMAALRGVLFKISRSRAPKGTFQSVVDRICPQQVKATHIQTVINGLQASDLADIVEDVESEGINMSRCH